MRGLLFSTIIATGAVAGTAFAIDNVEINGEVKFAVQGTDQAGREGFGYAQDWEFEFRGNQDLDNGMNVFFDFEVDAQGGENVRTDDITAGLRGSFGTITVGNFNLSKVQAGLGLVPTAAGSAYLFGGLEAGDNQRNGNRYTYIAAYTDRPSVAYTTPNIGGFVAGAQYQIQGDAGQGMGNDNENTRSENTSVGARYTLSAGDATVTVGAAYTNMASQNSANADDASMAIGASVAMGAFTVMAAHKSGEHNADYDLTQVRGMYRTGPWTVSAAFAQGTNEMNTAPGGNQDNGGVALDYQGYDVSASYNLGGGATVSGGYVTDELGQTSTGTYGIGLHVRY
jgi:predicted porin